MMHVFHSSAEQNEQIRIIKGEKIILSSLQLQQIDKQMWTLTV